ncbi:hypothetical protein [Phenylobacterium sp.]|uniref:hypothetical protein n=1 Tax=Phenylobacterium sp. TaxID=1871053 RepID=UPI0035B4577F
MFKGRPILKWLAIAAAVFVALGVIGSFLPDPPPTATPPSQPVMTASAGSDAGAPLGDDDSGYPMGPPPAPAHNWFYQEGREYGYQGALSEADQRAGVGAPEVFMYRYLGEKDGVYSVATVSHGTYAVASCTNPCEVVKIVAADAFGRDVQRLAFNPDTIVGLALEDAFNGQLELYEPPRPKPVETVVVTEDDTPTDPADGPQAVNGGDLAAARADADR